MKEPQPPTESVSIPLKLLFLTDLHPTKLRTWARLRSLAPDGQQSPSINWQHLYSLTGLSKSSLYRHMELLRTIGWLSWKPDGDGSVVIEFPDIGQRELPSLLNHLKNNLNIISLREGAFPDSQSPIAGTKVKRRRPRKDEPSKGPVRTYYRQTKIRPNQAQRRLIESQVSDIDMWRETVQHWLLHSWNPKNIPGMLELYDRGGPPGCIACSPQPDIYDKLMKEMRHGNPHPDHQYP
jgi:hypothetical protein